MAEGKLATPLSHDRVLGSWRLISWVTRDVATGERRDALGANPCGSVIYTPERVTFLILKSDRKRPEQLPPSDDEKVTLFDTMFAYSGRYTIEPDRIIHHVDMSWNQAWNGTDQVRYYVVENDTLTISSAPGRSPFDGREIVHEVEFRRES